MLNSNQLDEMSRMKIDKIDKRNLVDINNVKIDTSLPVYQRMQNYLEQIKNPYCFMCGKTPVQISFKSDDKELGSLLERHFMSLKNG